MHKKKRVIGKRDDTGVLCRFIQEDCEILDRTLISTSVVSWFDKD